MDNRRRPRSDVISRRPGIARAASGGARCRAITLVKTSRPTSCSNSDNVTFRTVHDGPVMVGGGGWQTGLRRHVRCHLAVRARLDYVARRTRRVLRGCCVAGRVRRSRSDTSWRPWRDVSPVFQLFRRGSVVVWLVACRLNGPGPVENLVFGFKRKRRRSTRSRTKHDRAISIVETVVL